MLYTLTIGLSALPLFLAQPLVSKMLLPMFGVGASVWMRQFGVFPSNVIDWLCRKSFYYPSVRIISTYGITIILALYLVI